MDDFLLLLHAIFDRSPDMQPFVCDGNPLTCTTAIIDVAPVAAISFARHWSDQTGMDRVAWRRDCHSRGTTALDPSQATMARFLPLVASRVIALSAHGMHGIGPAEPGEYCRTADVLHFMLGAVKPAVVLCVGSTAVQVVRGIAMPWNPVVIEAREFVDWDAAYELGLARRVNAVQSASDVASTPSAQV